MRCYFLELYSYITYCISEHRCPLPGHPVSFRMIIRIPKMTVIIFIAHCTEQIVWAGNVWYVPATEFLDSSPRYGFHCLCCLYSVPAFTGLVAGQLRPQRLPAHPLQNFSSHCLMLYNITYCCIHVKSKFSSPIRSVHLLRFELFWEMNIRV